MKKFSFVVISAFVLALGLSASARMEQTSRATARQASPAPAAATKPVAPVPSHTSAAITESQTALVKQYCASCHNDRNKNNAGGLSLAGFDAARVGHDAQVAEVAEKMIRKLRAGMMPPANARRPEGDALAALAASMEARLDQAAALAPNPGRRPFQRLNRAEYARAVRALLDIEVDVNAFLPPDTISAGFDNVADAQAFSATVMEGYLRAASRISTLAVGDPKASPSEYTYKVPRTASQMHHVEGAPFGTRGGIAVEHTFPADGEYSFRLQLHSIPTGQLFGSTVRGELVEVSIDGERAAVLEINPRMSEADPSGMNIVTPRVHVKAGTHRLAAAFVQRFDAVPDDLLPPIDHSLADSQIGSGFGITTLPHLREFAVSGPFKVTGVSDTPSRRRIFTCRPTAAAEEPACAAAIIRALATQAYRGPLTSADMNGLMKFYEQGRFGGSPRRSSPDSERAEAGDFESGIRMALQAMLASPRFLFRLEEAPATIRAGQSYRISDLDLATRLSFFLWGAGPDAELLKIAQRGTLRGPGVLAAQVKRMLADPKSEALATRFGAQWLRLQDLEKIYPDALLFPYYDFKLGEALRKETELFFDSIVREDRSILELLTADYTFVNERVARHYGIPNVNGERFQRVTLADDNRRGLLGHGSILALTSVADRTSPVLRGKWIMEVLLASPPPAPPPNVPTLDETKAESGDGGLLSTRQRMEQHRANPQCSSCHRVIDPLGLALENFDVTGRWRIRDNGNLVDPVGDLYDGTKMTGPTGLRAALLKHQNVFFTSFTESLLTYSLGRRVEYFDQPAIRKIVRDAARDNNRFSAYVLGVVNSRAFQMARADDMTTTNDDNKSR
jgi:mono/diheme cytochrome c family protein